MSINSNLKRDIVTLMMDFENGDLDQQQTIDLFQQLIDSGTVWHLQGCYGRMASELIRNGYCQLGKESHQDAYGNTVASCNDPTAAKPKKHRSLSLRCLDYESLFCFFPIVS